jgi:hypothetical protein
MDYFALKYHATLTSLTRSKLFSVASLYKSSDRAQMLTSLGKAVFFATAFEVIQTLALDADPLAFYEQLACTGATRGLTKRISLAK